MTLRSDRSAMLPLLVIALAFVAIGVWLRNDSPMLAWIDIIFFSACALVFLINMVPNGSYLRLTEEGFIVRNAFRSRVYQWDQVKEFGVSKVGLRKMVAWNPAEQPQKLTETSGAPTGYVLTLPQTYGHSAEELADLLNGVRDRYAH